MSARQKKLTPEVMQELRNKPGFMPLNVRFFQTLSR